MFRIVMTRSVVAAATMLVMGCSSGMMDTGPGTQLLSVSPRGGAAGISTSPDIVLTFNRPMMAGVEQYMALHQGGPTGPTMPMTCNWSDGQKTLTCHLTQPLAPANSYTVHMGGGMTDSDGQSVGMDRYGMGMGGQWATSGMMGGQGGMMGTGWRDTNGSYGMVFGFTTR